MATLACGAFFLTGGAACVAQVAQRICIIADAPNTFSAADLPFRINRFLFDVVLQRRTIRERPAAGLMHALVFWGFVAFAGYTSIEFLFGLGVVDLTHTSWFEGYRTALVPFAAAVLVGI